jgi:hypothetical protein
MADIGTAANRKVNDKSANDFMYLPCFIFASPVLNIRRRALHNRHREVIDFRSRRISKNLQGGAFCIPFGNAWSGYTIKVPFVVLCKAALS